MGLSYGTRIVSTIKTSTTFFHSQRSPLQDEEFRSEAASNTCSLGNPDFIRIGHSHFPTGVLRDMGPFVSREPFKLTHRSLIKRRYTYVIANHAVTKLYIISWMYTLNSRNDMRWRKQRPQKVGFALNTRIFDRVRDLPALNMDSLRLTTCHSRCQARLQKTFFLLPFPLVHQAEKKPLVLSLYSWRVLDHIHYSEHLNGATLGAISAAWP